MKKIYHSALKPELDISKELSFCQSDQSQVFQHDITKGIPEVYKQCDVIYCEPSWSHGYPIFNKRASATESTYWQYIKELTLFVQQNKKQPIYFIVENKIKEMFLQGKQPTQQRLINIHNYPATLLVFNNTAIIGKSIKTNYDLINALAKEFNLVGDFSCGYGNTAKAFKDQGKNFICSDINGKCIYYVAKELLGYAE